MPQVVILHVLLQPMTAQEACCRARKGETGNGGERKGHGGGGMRVFLGGVEREADQVNTHVCQYPT